MRWLKCPATFYSVRDGLMFNKKSCIWEKRPKIQQLIDFSSMLYSRTTITSCFELKYLHLGAFSRNYWHMWQGMQSLHYSRWQTWTPTFISLSSHTNYIQQQHGRGSLQMLDFVSCWVGRNFINLCQWDFVFVIWACL